jgi:hypothetical protein
MPFKNTLPHLWLLLLFPLLLLFLNACGPRAQQQEPLGGPGTAQDSRRQGETGQTVERVIFDNDVGGDIDDAGALAVLHALADRGEIELLAMGVVIGHEAAVPYVHAVNTWYGRPDLPIGTIKGQAPYARDEYMVPIVAEYPHTLTQETAPDVVQLYRQVLASQPDQSVTLIVVGPATNIRNLLHSGPDEHSPLTGVELMRRKIKFYGAGGNGNGGLPKGKCGFNYYTDLESAKQELERLPTDFPTVFAGGSGNKLRIGSALRNARPDHIIRKSYEAYYKGEAKDRQTWDQLRVLYGSRPAARTLWDTSPAGTIEVMLDSTITWTATPDRNRAFAYLNDLEAMRSTLTELMLYDPRDK